MKPIELIIFILALSGSECRSGIIEEKSDLQKSVTLAEAAVKTLLSCYEKEVITVGAAGISERIHHKVLLEASIPLALIGNYTARATVNNQTVDKRSRHKLQLFVVEASSIEQLDQIFVRVKSSQWWNHMATYLILQQNQQSCSDAAQYVWGAWIRNILNALYVCLDKPKEKVLVYSFNPYTSRAPAPWLLENIYKGEDNHPFSLFVREYLPGNKREICNNINFIKTHDLGGYRIDVSLQTHFRRSDVEKVGFKKMLNAYPHPIAIRKALHSHYSLTFYTNEETQESMSPITKNIISGNSDMILNPQYIQLLKNMTHTSVFIRSGLKVITQYRGEMSQLEKILAVLDRSTRYGLCLVVLITLLFFKFFMRESLGSAILNVVRIIANSSLHKVPKNDAPRLYLAGIFILVVTIVGIYQGVIASLLTKPKPLPDVETMEDLMKSPHKIHGDKEFADLFSDPIFNGRFIAHNTVLCIPYVVRDPLAACLADPLYYTKEVMKHSLHFSRDVIVPMDHVYVIREDWPLEERINEIIATFTENHHTHFLFSKKNEEKLQAAESNAKWEQNRPSKVMTLNDLGFAFAILGIGLGLATVAFIVEVGIKRFERA